MERNSPPYGAALFGNWNAYVSGFIFVLLVLFIWKADYLSRLLRLGPNDDQFIILGLAAAGALVGHAASWGKPTTDGASRVGRFLFGLNMIAFVSYSLLFLAYATMPK
jgi:hypothetical protein